MNNDGYNNKNNVESDIKNTTADINDKNDVTITDDNNKR